ncbi:MAG TPA: exodeoxyribonuclease III [Candidatus Limiplasma sp.]|nr:exodeoxyribonuclease III [Candidatus Limiplasma sp.]
MKLISWNVNGLRACITKGFMDYFNRVDADFFCIQETKLQPHQIELNPEGYQVFWNSAEKKGYSGTAIFTKHTPLSVAYGLGLDEHDHEGRVITLEYEGFYLVTVYTPNSKRELLRLDYRMVWEDAFADYLQSLDAKKPVIVCGDMNVAHQEIDLKNPKTNVNNAGFTPQEREKMTTLLSRGFIDTFRRLHPDEIDRYSWWSYMMKSRDRNIGWRIDYFLVSERLASKIANADIDDQVPGSDHCPVTLELDIE